MSFQIQVITLSPLPDSHDPLTEYRLENTITGEFAIVSPYFGGILRRLVLGNSSDPNHQDESKPLFSVLKAPESVQALEADETYASALLYPYPSRIKSGIYNFDGFAYTLPLNETNRDNSIHGLVHPHPFTVVRQEETSLHALLALQYDYSGDVTGYPFPFALTVTYSLSAMGLTLVYSALNTGTARCPAAFGWHTYFTLKSAPGFGKIPVVQPGEVEDDTLIDELEISLPTCTAVVLDEDLIATGTEPFPESHFSLHERQLDNAFIVETTDDTAQTVLHSPKRNISLIVTQQTGPGKFNYLVVYTPVKRDSIAIESLTANVNAFNNDEGLVVLNPGETLTGRINIRLT